MLPVLKGLAKHSEEDMNRKGTILAQRVYEAWSAALQCVEVVLKEEPAEACFYYELCRLRTLDCKKHDSFAHLLEVIEVLHVVISYQLPTHM
jgi:hypothetical protein